MPSVNFFFFFLPRAFAFCSNMSFLKVQNTEALGGAAFHLNATGRVTLSSTIRAPTRCRAQRWAEAVSGKALWSVKAVCHRASKRSGC